MGRHELPEGLEKGSIVAGVYRVDHVLGVGGMAVVVAAVHVERDEPVALKVMLPVLAEDPALVARFRREARASASLRSPHVVRVTDVGALPTGEPFMVMELLQGRDLEKLSRRGHLPDADVVAYAIQACVGLVAAHDRGIIHRDVKPSNLLLTRSEDGRPLVKVLDFGISRVRDEAALTSVGHVVGSLGYMPPEQLGGVADLDERADVYALGVTLYELLSRTRAYAGASIIDVSQRIIEGAAPDLATLRPDLPAELAALVMTAMDRRRDRRPGSVVELALALAPFASAHADEALATLRRHGEEGAAQVAPPVESTPATEPTPPVEPASPGVEPEPRDEPVVVAVPDPAPPHRPELREVREVPEVPEVPEVREVREVREVPEVREVRERVVRRPARGGRLVIRIAGLLTGAALALVIALVARLLLASLGGK